MMQKTAKCLTTETDWRERRLSWTHYCTVSLYICAFCTVSLPQNHAKHDVGWVSRDLPQSCCCCCCSNSRTQTFSSRGIIISHSALKQISHQNQPLELLNFLLQHISGNVHSHLQRVHWGTENKICFRASLHNDRKPNPTLRIHTVLTAPRSEIDN